MTQATGATDSTAPDGSEPRTPAEIEREIEATRSRLAGTIDQIGERVSPASIAQRAKATALAQVVDEKGAIRTKRVLAAGGTAVGILGLKVLAAIRKRHHSA